MLVLAIDTCGPSGSVALGRVSVRPICRDSRPDRAGWAQLFSNPDRSRCRVAVRRRHRVEATGRNRRRQRPRQLYRRARGTQHRQRSRRTSRDSSRRRLASRSLRLQVKRPVRRFRCPPPRSLSAISNPQTQRRPSCSQAPSNWPISIPSPAKIAVCDDAAASLLSSASPTTELIRVHSPHSRRRARSLPRPLILARQFVDLVLLDGHYLRRSDAEIFGEPNTQPGLAAHEFLAGAMPDSSP